MDDENKRSSFNEAKLKMSRIDKLQDIINLCSVNKLELFRGISELGLVASGRKNYEVIFSCTCQLLKEVAPKMNNADKALGKLKKNVLRQFMILNPVFSRLSKDNGQNKEVLNIANWVVIEENLDDFETFVREMLEKHELAGQNREDDDEL